jgi:hypothetical protein
MGSGWFLDRQAEMILVPPPSAAKTPIPHLTLSHEPTSPPLTRNGNSFYQHSLSLPTKRLTLLSELPTVRLTANVTVRF